MINNQHMQASSPVFVPTGMRAPVPTAGYVPKYQAEAGQNAKTASGQQIILLDRAVNAQCNEMLFSKPVDTNNNTMNINKFLHGLWCGNAVDLRTFVSGYILTIGELSQLHHELCSVLYCAHVYESVLDPEHSHDGHYLKKLSMYLEDMRKQQDSHDLMLLSHMIKKVQQPWERLFITLQYQMNAHRIFAQ